MPTPIEGMLDVVAADLNTTLSTSDPAHLKSAFPRSPQFSDAGSAPATTIDGESVTLTREGYRLYYGTHVLGGDNSEYQHNFGTTVSKDYSDNGPPDLEDLTIIGTTFEPPQGNPLSTVLPHGLGPNVNTFPAQALLGWVPTGPPDLLTDPEDQSDPMLGTPTSLPFVGDGSANPSDTSLTISSAGLHGTVIPGVSADSEPGGA